MTNNMGYVVSKWTLTTSRFQELLDQIDFVPWRCRTHGGVVSRAGLRGGVKAVGLRLQCRCVTAGQFHPESSPPVFFQTLISNFKAVLALQRQPAEGKCAPLVATRHDEDALFNPMHREYLSRDFGQTSSATIDASGVEGFRA